jgi:hypothetical protein
MSEVVVGEHLHQLVAKAWYSRKNVSARSCWTIEFMAAGSM